ncbi:MAG: zf-HC2 domain-containing protein [Elusimicrobia bacterium]|nr:zf-HC2 domain-containing protein [Elusimicrobiota bacterium]
MNCRKAKKMISDYIDGFLNPEERVEFESHIRTCRNCMKELEEMERLKEILKIAPRPLLPENFHTKLHYKLLEVKEKESKKRENRIFDFFRPVSVRITAIAALTVIICVAIFTGRPKEVIYMSGINHVPENYSTISMRQGLPLNGEGILKLNFVSKKKVKDVELIIEMPDGIKTVDNKKTICWRGTLRKGENIILLKVKGVKPGMWDVVTSLHKNSVKKRLKRKIFVKPVRI